MAGWQDAVAKIGQQMGDLSPSQRVAIGLGAVLVLGSLLWLAQWAATPEMVPLLPQNLDSAELTQIASGLDALGEHYRVDGSQVLVRAGANRPAILARLQQADALPTDTALGFAQLVQEANPWISQAENNRRWTVALSKELESVLQQFAGVRQARVMLNLNARARGFARSQPQATASVTLFMSGGVPVERGMALAAARMVAGAVRGLPVANVQVVDGGTGRVALEWDQEESGSASNLHQQRKQLEREKELQIKEQLSFDEAALVSVSVELDFSSTHIEDSRVSEGTTLKEDSETTTTVRNRPVGAPGVEPNVGVVANAGGTVDQSDSSTSEIVNEPSRTRRSEQTPAGVPKSITAAVSLSYSYLASIHQRNNPEREEAATAEQIEAIFIQQKDRIAAHVAKLVLPQDPEQVSVVWHYDTLEPETVIASSTLDTSLDLAQKFGPASGLALLAVLALGMMMRLARNNGTGDSFGMEIGLPKEAIDAARAAAADLRAGAARPPGGAAMGGQESDAFDAAAYSAGAPSKIPTPFSDTATGVLDAQEVDETTMQVREMLAQVQQMTNQDSRSVASILEHWIEKGNR